jgi:hypothetical protein
MLRITTQEDTGQIRLLLEGKLTGAWVVELEETYKVCRSYRDGREIVADLAGLTAADNAGRYLLSLLRSDGARIENARHFQDSFLPIGTTDTETNAA